MILPAFATVFFGHQYEIGAIPIAVAALAPVFVSLICGIWLGIAWKGFPAVKVALRTWYSSIISTLLIALGNHPDLNKAHLITLFAQIEKTYGFCFYCGWFLGSSARDVILDIYYSPRQREIVKRRHARFRLWFRAALEIEPDDALNPTDRLVGRAIRNVLTNPAQMITCVTAVFACFVVLYRCVSWLMGNR